MENQKYKIDAHKIKNYVETLEQVTREYSKHKNLPKGYNKIKDLEDKVELLEGKVLRSLHGKFYKGHIYRKINYKNKK